MRPRIIRISPYDAADPNAITTAETLSGGGADQSFAITGVKASGGVATLDIPRQVVITPAGDDSGRIFVVEGTNRKDNYQVEAIVGGNATATQTVQAFKTITKVRSDGNTASTVEVGTGTKVNSNWLPLDYYALPFEVALALQVSLATSPDFTVELTLSNILRRKGNLDADVDVRDDFDLIYPPFIVSDHDTLANVTSNATGNIDFPVRAVRLLSNTVFTVGTVSLEVIQASGRR